MAAEASGGIDALGQFQLSTHLGPIGASVNFTYANTMMLVASMLTLGLLIIGMRPRAMVPGRLQAAAELGYETIMSMCVESIGEEGKKYFPVVFTLFFFILFGNLLGVFPHFFTFTSHIAVTMALSLFVFVFVTAVALKEHGLHFFSYFVPPGVPALLIPLMVLKAMRGEKLPVYGKGDNIRDWLYVEDHAAALRLVVAKAKPGDIPFASAGVGASTHLVWRRRQAPARLPDPVLGQQGKVGVDAEAVGLILPSAVSAQLDLLVVHVFGSSPTLVGRPTRLTPRKLQRRYSAKSL